ncbi:hypothetical protein EHQ23_02440 [Leptospira bourretii]|uniref:Uncharacterized protein n=1 Tax=Leptospira bourretii TaxID=2484962 RepID=A0A4R9IP27_9LEPT|nr:hypothetical protein [Leptospira bourretii]TGK89995.1 hypothetical protein EHQ23_02440 [Leptospira bourretii]TGK92218.1 hypothetical protein EHQ26_09585 [Leptospira bourretii]TGL27497.1 hypothetical protein EHQ45_17535 [Leptospira bourretii]
MNTKEKKLILNAITQTKSFNYWGSTLISQYIQELKKVNPQIPSSYDRSLYSQNIIHWVKECDTDLKIFLIFNQTFERQRTKTTSLLQLSNSKREMLQNLTVNFKEIDYDPYITGSWETPALVYSKSTENEFEFWFAIKAEKSYNHPIDPEKLTSKTITEIETALKEVNPNFESLEELVARYAIFSRVINIVKIGKQDGKLLFSTDQPKFVDPDLDEKSGISPETRLENFIQQSLEILKVKNPEKVHAEITKSRRINKTNVDKIQAIADKIKVIVPYKHEQKYVNGELSEKNSNKFENFTIQMIRKKIKEYFDLNSTLEGFFSKNPQLDAEHNGHIIRSLNNDDQVERFATGFFFCILNSKGHIEISKVYVNSALGSLRIIPEKGGQENERLNEELDRIFS